MKGKIARNVTVFGAFVCAALGVLPGTASACLCCWARSAWCHRHRCEVRTSAPCDAERVVTKHPLKDAGVTVYKWNSSRKEWMEVTSGCKSNHKPRKPTEQLNSDLNGLDKLTDGRWLMVPCEESKEAAAIVACPDEWCLYEWHDEGGYWTCIKSCSNPKKCVCAVPDESYGTAASLLLGAKTGTIFATECTLGPTGIVLPTR